MKRLVWVVPVLAALLAGYLLWLLIDSVVGLRGDASSVGDQAAVAQAIAAAAGLVVSLILVLVTSWYVVETRRMVGEMRSSRVESSRPNLLLRMEAVNTTSVVVGLINAGPGSARDISLTLEFTRPDAGSEDRRAWRYQFMAPGESFQFLAIDAKGSVTTDFDRVVKDVTTVRAVGEACAADGTSYPVDTTLDVTGWGQEVKVAHQRFATAPDLRIAKAIERLADS